MSEKKLSYIILAGVVLLAIVYLYAAIQLPRPSGKTLGPQYFPIILGVMLLLLSALDFVVTYRKKTDAHIKLPNFRYILAATGLIVIFVLAWQYIGFFYIFCFLFLFSMISMFRPKEQFRKKMWVNGLIALCTAGAIYLIFDITIGIHF